MQNCVLVDEEQQLCVYLDITPAGPSYSAAVNFYQFKRYMFVGTRRTDDEILEDIYEIDPRILYGIIRMLPRNSDDVNLDNL